MQRFVAELSGVIDKTDFERSWNSDPGLDANRTVSFVFDQRRVSICIDSRLIERWPAEDLHRTFSNAIRRIDRSCNVRWL